MAYLLRFLLPIHEPVYKCRSVIIKTHYFIQLQFLLIHIYSKSWWAQFPLCYFFSWHVKFLWTIHIYLRLIHNFCTEVYSAVLVLYYTMYKYAWWMYVNKSAKIYNVNENILIYIFANIFGAECSVSFLWTTEESSELVENILLC